MVRTASQTLIMRLGDAWPASAHTCKVPTGLEVQCVLSGLLMLMMTCKEDQEFKPAAADALLSASQSMPVAPGAQTLALLHYAE